MAKLAPRDLAQVLSKLPKQENENIVVGYENADDAGIFRLNDGTCLVQTLDFFTPVSDDPAIYGKIAAINSLNDVYAMGGKPLTALSIVCYPQKGDWDVLGEILRGGHEAMSRENVAILGGHSIDDAEIKFGYSVTGIVDSKSLITNAGAQPGDVLVLTKPIGTGVISTAVKFGKARSSTVEAAMKVMTGSARTAAEAMTQAGATSCTDVTGFGFLGHAYEMAEAGEVTFVIESQAVPMLPDVAELIGARMLTRGDKNNRDYIGANIRFSDDVSSVMQSALFDPQTAGGLLISVSKKRSGEILEKLPEARIVGLVERKGDFLLEVE